MLRFIHGESRPLAKFRNPGRPFQKLGDLHVRRMLSMLDQRIPSSTLESKILDWVGKPIQERLVEISRPKRFVFAVIGVGLVGLAGIGAVLPGIPTVGPLMLASFFLLKSSPALEKRLVRNRFFGKYICYLDGTSELPTRTRISSIAMMWVSIFISGLIIHFSSPGRIWLLVVLAIAGLIGTVFIWRFRRSSVGMV